MILHWATPVTVSGTPWAVSTFSHIGFRVITSSDRRCTSVTSHQAHAHPPTIVRFRVDPQQPPGVEQEEKKNWFVEWNVLVRQFKCSINVGVYSSLFFRESEYEDS